MRKDEERRLSQLAQEPDLEARIQLRWAESAERGYYLSGPQERNDLDWNDPERMSEAQGACP